MPDERTLAEKIESTLAELTALVDTHEKRIAAAETVLGQLSHNDGVHGSNAQELAGALLTLKAILDKQSEQLVALNDIVKAQTHRAEQLRTVLDQHHKFLERLYERTGEQPPSSDQVN